MIKWISVKEAGISNNANIFVVKKAPVVFIDNSRHLLYAPIEIYFGINERVSDLIERNKEKLGSAEKIKDMEFIFNGKKLEMNLSLDEAGIKEYSRIYVIPK